MTERIRDMLNQYMDLDEAGNLSPISMAEIITSLNATLEDLEAFKTKEALERLKSLKGCDIPSDIRHKLKEAIGYLKNYDDIEARKLIEEMIMFVNDHEEKKEELQHGGGYHSSRLY